MKYKLFNNKFLVNSLWLIIDKIYLLIGGLFVTAIVARYLGPENLGKLTYGITLSLFCSTISQWGANFFIFNVAAKRGHIALNYINSTASLRVCIYLLSWFICSIYLYFTLDEDDFFLVSILTLSGIFSGLDIYQYYFNGILNSKYNARASIIVKTISMVLKSIFVYTNSNLWFFIFPTFIEGFITYIYKFKITNARSNIKLSKSRMKKYSRRYFMTSGQFLISSLLVLIFTKVNELTLQNISSFDSLGIYISALTLANAWTFLPLSIGISLLTAALKDENIIRHVFILQTIFIISIPILIFVMLFSNEIVDIIYGSKYMEGAKILFILSVSSLFSVLNVITNRYITSLDFGGRYLNKKMIAISILSILLTYTLISQEGVYGAAYAILIIEVLSLTLGNYFFKEAKIIEIHKNILSINSFRYNFLYFKD